MNAPFKYDNVQCAVCTHNPTGSLLALKPDRFFGIVTELNNTCFELGIEKYICLIMLYLLVKPKEKQPCISKVFQIMVGDLSLHN